MKQLLWKSTLGPQKVNKGLPCDLAIKLLFKYPRELKEETQKYIPIFLVALFIIAKRKKRPNYPSRVHQQMNGKAKCSACI